MGLRGLRDALEQPYDVLSQGRRTAAERHRSLTDVVDWSYRLLTPRQRDLFTRLAVFAGQVEWDAIVNRFVVDGDEDGPEFSDLADLVDRSLVTVHLGDPTTYGMLETLRAFGRRQLPEPAMGRCEANIATGRSRWPKTRTQAEVTPHQGSARRRFDAHLAEIRRAHAFLSSSGPGERFAPADHRACPSRHTTACGSTWCASSTRRSALSARCSIRFWLDSSGSQPTSDGSSGELDTAEQRCEQAFALARALGDPTLGCGGA